MNDFQENVNNLVWDNGYTRVVSGPTRGDALFDVYLLRHSSSLNSCTSLPGISDHNEVLLEVEWGANYREPRFERIVPVYHKIDIVDIQDFLRETFKLWAGNGSCVEEIWRNFKEIIFEGIERYVPHKILSKNRDTEYCNKEVKRLKVKVRKVYNKRKLGRKYQADLKLLSKELLVAKRKSQESFIRSVLQNESGSWTEFYKYVK